MIPSDPILPIAEEPVEGIDSEGFDRELDVTFSPQLFLQRRMWILDVLRREKVTDVRLVCCFTLPLLIRLEVVDIGCGEGSLLNALVQPSPWLDKPPDNVLPSENIGMDAEPRLRPVYNAPYPIDPIPNLHVTRVSGLDISLEDLDFACAAVQPPLDLNKIGPVVLLESKDSGDAKDTRKQDGEMELRSLFTLRGYAPTPTLRFDPLLAQIFKGGLEVMNEAFLSRECIVSSEVIEHLPPHILPFFAPMLLGVYNPRLVLITTPSYTFNARWTSPNAPISARKGHRDPTGRTDRIFRHPDHKFEWTVEEFREWCETEAKGWGYEVTVNTIGRAIERDPWGRDESLGGASAVALFRRVGEASAEIQIKARKKIAELGSTSPIDNRPHEMLLETKHSAHPMSQKPHPPDNIADYVKNVMEGYQEAFMRLEEVWYATGPWMEKEEAAVSVLCGGWIEVLIRAIEESTSLLLKPGNPPSQGVSSPIVDNNSWTVELVGGVALPLWSSRPVTGDDSFRSDWLPVEEEYDYADESDDREYNYDAGADDPHWEEGAPVEDLVQEVAWQEGDSTDADISWNEWDPADRAEGSPTTVRGWGEGIKDEETNPWNAWSDTDSEGIKGKTVHLGVHSEGRGEPISSTSSTTGWDADADTDTTSATGTT